MSAPTPEQLAHLIGHADHRALTPTEAAALRAGVADLQRRLAAAETTLHRRTQRLRKLEGKASR